MLHKLIGGRIAPTLLGLAMMAAALWLPNANLPFFTQLIERLDGVAYDVRLNSVVPQYVAPDERIVIVAVDEKSLSAVGRWPWSRDKIAELTRRLFANGAVVVGYDVMFSEAQENHAAHVLSRLATGDGIDARLAAELRALQPRFDYDSALADAFSEHDVVLGYLFHTEENPKPGPLPPALLERSEVTWNIDELLSLPSYTANLETIQEAAAANAFLTTIPDIDGVLRRSPLLLRYGDNVYGSLALEMAKLYFLLDKIEVNTASIGDNIVPESISLGSKRVPIDGVGRAIIPYRGPSPAFSYISASDVLSGEIEAGALENKLVLVGATALGLGDVVATPVQNIYPGVEIHASLLAGILDERFPMEPSWARGANLVVIAALGGLLALGLPWLGPIPLLLTATAFIVGIAGVNIWFWNEERFSLQLALPMLLVTGQTGLNLAFGFVRAAYQRRQLKNMFGHYVPPELVDIMMDDPEHISTAGESREMSVLFADIRSFTTISETLDPSALKSLLNQFFGEMTKVIFDQRGTIDKYVGDMIMAFWGAPLRDENHAQHAVEAALGMLRAVDELRPKLVAQGLPEVHIGIGVNSGTMNVGDMGSEFRRAYTVIGDSVNLASRLEGLTKFYGVGLVIGEETKRQLQGFVCRSLDRVRVKGKTQAIEVFEPICLETQLGESQAQTLANYQKALYHFYAQEWDKAQMLLQELQKTQPHRVYELYLERIEEVRHRDLGEHWDGVYERRTK